MQSNLHRCLTILTPCRNEEENIREAYNRIRDVILSLPGYRYEHIFIDNASTDSTCEILRELARNDRNVRVIFNARNFGHIRSPMHALYQAKGDAVIGIVSDLQDPPELIVDMVRYWEQGFPMVLAIKRTTEEHGLICWLRKQYYRTINRISNIETYENFTGFGLFDRKVVEIIKDFKDPYPYFRGMIAEIGLPHVSIPYDQPKRKRGFTKNNLYTLYDMAMLAVTRLSVVPLRLVTFAGFVTSLLCVLTGVFYFAYKLLYWDRFDVGIAPLVIGIFFFASLQMLALGIIGEYIGSINTMVQNRPLVVERERINFEYPPGEPLRDGLQNAGPTDDDISSTASLGPKTGSLER